MNQHPHLMNTYARIPVAFTHGKGALLWDDAGNQYLDSVSGLGVTALGHAHPEVAEVICDQAKKLIHTSNLAHIPWQEKLAEKLSQISGLDKSFIANSGTEAIECALKMVRLEGHRRGIDQAGVIVMENSFHGRSMAALSATGSRKVQAGFEPLVGGFVRVPFGDISAVRNIASRSNQIVAVLAEPIQGEAGIRVAEPGYLVALRELCDQQKWLLIFDEIQSGLCRTGNWYAYQHESATPDILTTAKAMANGFPIGACLARGEAAELLTPGRHGTTFGGNPLACRTACTVLDIMERDDLPNRSGLLGARMLNSFKDRLESLSVVRDVRGRGLMIGIELDQDINHLKDLALEQGLLINVTRNNVVRLLPPLIISDSQADQIVSTVCELVEQL